MGEGHDPDPPALEQGTGRDLTCQPRSGHDRDAPRVNWAGVGLIAGCGPASALAHSTPMQGLCYPGEATLFLPPQKITNVTGHGLRPVSSRLQDIRTCLDPRFRLSQICDSSGSGSAWAAARIGHYETLATSRASATPGGRWRQAGRPEQPHAARGRDRRPARQPAQGH